MSQLPGKPDTDIDITLELVGGLLSAQHPDLISMPLSVAGEGWDNVMVRIGDTLAARLPRHAVGERLLKVEQEWLPKISRYLPLQIPSPVRVGQPFHNYPFTWSIVNWVEGECADVSPPTSDQAGVLAAFLRCLHDAPVTGGPKNSHRDGPLSGKKQMTELRLLELEKTATEVSPAIWEQWREALSTPRDLDRCIIAADMHPQNVIVDGGKLAAIIDWGDMCVGDPATDLASVWALFDDAADRQAVLTTYGASDATIARARGWAVFFGATLFHAGLKGLPRHEQNGRSILRRLSEDYS